MIHKLVKSTKNVLSKSSTNYLLPKQSSFQYSNSSDQEDVNNKDLQIHNSFTKTKQPATINGKLISLKDHRNHDLQFAKAYICGPTVYDESHIGHAMTYLRFDLIRRILRRYFSVYLVSIINITDIDDKIIAKARQENKSCTDLSNYYLSSFLNDLHSLNILPFNAYIPVTGQIENIVKYIQVLESNGLAYLNDKTGDIELDSSRIDFELDHFKTEPTTHSGRRSSSDFTLWKARKPDEPYWTYESKVNNRIVEGRPGWHVECSTISQTALGNRIDFHFGGHDLLFPHHVNESRCCKAFNSINDSNQTKDESIHKWSNQWLHFGSLKINESKMSKSLNNFIQIKKFLEKNSINLLRILCLLHPYRRDITFDEGNLVNAEEQNMKIVNFYQLLNDRKSKLISSSKLEFKETGDLDQLIRSFNQRNQDGLVNDFSMDCGWQALIELIGQANKHIELWTLYDLLKLELIVDDYIGSMGLIFGNAALSNERNPNDQLIIQKLVEYRKEVRALLLNELVSGNKSKNLETMIKLTDTVRNDLASNHLIIRDEKFVKKK